MGSAASTWLKLDPGLIAPLAGFLVILTGAGCLALEIGSWCMVGLLIAVSATAELIGLYTGYPFGRYEYSSRWWPVIPLGSGHFFPVLLPFAWILIVGGGYLSVRLFTSGWKASFLTALLATLIDAPMERAMVGTFGYWAWNEPGPVFGAPLLNSGGWFLVSLIAASLLGRKGEGLFVSRAPWVLGLFCLFVACAGLLKSLDSAWLVLAAYSGILGWTGWTRGLSRSQ